ncbi:MAG: flagellar hook-associated protein FlgL [Candidatus Eremiobacteraeota bacterium]|nr:flagellar hook-associated protein FlgL [Candidatus Eremiobacteraeota bacterium]
MRIATSTIFDNQTAAIDTLVAQQQQYGATLSSGKQLNQPSDDPTRIAQDLTLRTSIQQGAQTDSNVQNISAQLTTVDGALSSLSGVMQKARSVAVEGASDVLTPDQRTALANQVDGLLQQAIGIANTQYAGKYVFAGTASPLQNPVVANGQPTSSVAFSGNLSGETVQLPDGQSLKTSVTLGEAFNYAAPDGSPDVFQTLIALRDTLAKGSVVDASTSAVNKPGTALIGNPVAPALSTALGSANFSTPLQTDASGSASFAISSGTAPGGISFTFGPASTIQNVVSAINAQSAATGVTASFDDRTQALSLSGSGPFQIKDVPTASSANTGNLVETFKLQPQADLVNNLSRQIGDCDRTLQSIVGTRSALGGTIQNVASAGTSVDLAVANDTKVQSGIEDADIAKMVTQFSQTQTALQAAYGTTTRLESKSLFDYLQ